MLATLGIIQSSRPSAIPLLDTYTGAAAAYSLRKLRTAYSGSAIRVRRSSDNTEQDIGFTSSGALDESSLTTFVGANSGFVTKWYDQSGNARDAAQTTSANQPRIVNAGTVDKINNKPACYFDGSNDSLTIVSSTNSFKFLNDGTKWYNSSVVLIGIGTSAIFGNNAGTSGKNGIYLERDSVGKLNFAITNSSGSINTAPVNMSTSSGSFPSNEIKLFTILADPSNATASLRATIYINNSSFLTNGNTASVSNTAATHDFQFGTYGNNAGAISGYFQESIFYSSDQSSNRTGIQSNINSYYSIY